MENELVLVRLDADYCNYLRKFDDKVPYNYNEKELRPFIGVLFMVNGCKYFAPLSSPKIKHLKMRSKLDFLRNLQQFKRLLQVFFILKQDLQHHPS